MFRVQQAIKSGSDPYIVCVSARDSIFIKTLSTVDANYQDKLESGGFLSSIFLEANNTIENNTITRPTAWRCVRAFI